MIWTDGGVHGAVAGGIDAAGWFLIDTFVNPTIAIGELGIEQLQWLEQELDKRRDRPTLIVGHHNRQLIKPKRGGHWMGIWETDALLEMLDAKPHIHALIYGHTHNWQRSRRGDSHLVYLPATWYAFGKNNPVGWVAAALDKDGCHLAVHAIENPPR